MSSNLTLDSNLYLGSVTAAYQSPKLLVGVQIPAGMPKIYRVGLLVRSLALQAGETSSILVHDANLIVPV